MAKQKIRLLFLVILIHFTFAFVLMIPQVLLPFWQETFQLSGSVSSLLGAMFFVAYGLTSIPQSFLLNQIGLKKFILWASTLILAGSIVFVVYPTFYVGLVTFLVMGVGVTALQLAGSLAVKRMDDNPANYSRNYSLVLVIIGVGGLSGGLLAGMLVNRMALPWTAVYYLFAALALLLGLATTGVEFGAEAKTTHSASNVLSRYRAMVTNPRLLRYTAGIFIYLGVEIGIATWISTFFILHFRFDKIEAAPIVSLYWLMQTVGRLLGGYLLSRFRSGRVLTTFAAGCGVALVAAVAGISPLLSGAGFALAGFFTSIMYPVLFSAGLGQADRAQENVAAGVLSTAVIGGAFAPPVIGLVSEFSGSLGLGLAAVVIPALTYIAYLGLTHRPQNEGRLEPPVHENAQLTPVISDPM